jgi:hypothetical protein
MKPTQNHYTALFLLILLLALEIVRSPQVRTVFTSFGAGASSNLGAVAHGTANAQSAIPPLDWHLLLYWGIAALLVLALADVAPTVVTAILILIIAEELLVHWSAYTSLIQVPTK